jgi:type IV pilus assembly protein PilV
MPAYTSRIPRIPHRPARRQRGVMLIEALIAILIFSIGILGIIGLQASAVQQSSDAKNRAEASYLANQLIGKMWSGDRTSSTLVDQYDTTSCGSCAGLNAWTTTVQGVLPGVFTTTDTNPQVNVAPTTDPTTGAITSVVTVSIFWRSPNDNATDPTTRHHFDVETQIGQ